MCLCRISGAVLEGRAKHMEVPGEAVVERPGTRIGACRGREIVLQRRRDVICVAEVEVLRHVYCLE